MAQEFGFLTLDDIKQAVALDRLRTFENNITQAAKSLDITRPTLHKIMADFEKKDADTKKRIQSNQNLLSSIFQQDRSSWKFDDNSGMSVPVPPPPIPPVKLLKQPPMPDIVSEAGEKANAEIKQGTTLIRNPQMPTIRKGVQVGLASEATREKERFAKLDLTPMSVKKGLDGERGKAPDVAKDKKKKKASVK